MVRALPSDGNRYEAVDGELLVTPSPSNLHQRAAFFMAMLLHNLVQPLAAGEVLLSPADIELDEHTIVQPDVFVRGMVDGRLPGGWNSGAPLLLAIEILSPGTARHDRITKRRRYQRAGIPEYWIVDLDARTVERWLPGDERPEIISENLIWQPAGSQLTVGVDVAAYFDSVCGA